jgi:hypothetical protein
MTKTEGKTASAAVKDILLSNPDGLREVIRTVMQHARDASRSARRKDLLSRFRHGSHCDKGPASSVWFTGRLQTRLRTTQI